jgi:lysophospholipase L1-like esterase
MLKLFLRSMPLRRKFLLWFLSIAILFLLTALFVWRIWFTHPMGTGPAGPPVPREAFNTAWTSRPVLLLGIGDSVTAGFGARKGYSYFDRLAENPPDEWPDMQGLSLQKVFPNFQRTNLAASGSTSLEHEARQIPHLPHADSNTMVIVVMTTGGNDLIHSYGRMPPKEGAMFGATWEQAQPWVTNYATRLEQALEKITSAYPGGCHIFLANIYDPTDGTGDARVVGLPRWPDAMRIHAAYNEAIQRTASSHTNVHLVDLHEPFLGHGLGCAKFWQSHYRKEDPHYWYFVNLEDPNERGYDALRRLFLNEMVKARNQLR